MQLESLISVPSDLLALQPAELAWPLLEHLVRSGGKMHQANLVSDAVLRNVPSDLKAQCGQALMEAWQALLNLGLLAPEAGNPYPVYLVTRRGRTIESLRDFNEFIIVNAFPPDQLEAEIAEKAHPLYMRGEYETAVFQAMKSLEVAVREAGGFDLKTYGVDLMRKAFHPTTGPLTDKSEPEAEREALMHLFSGSIGRFKNPTSHRHVGIVDPKEAREILAMASHLLRITLERGRQRKP